MATPLTRSCAAVASWLLLTPIAEAQTLRRSLPSPQEFLSVQDDSLFSLTRSQEDIHGWEQAITELARGEHRSAVERLHNLLSTEIGGVVAIAPNRYVALRHAVVMTLANLSPTGTEAYENLVRREAGSLFDVKLHELSLEQLESVATRFPAADIGRRARLRLGDLALEQGLGVKAAAHFRNALEASPIGGTMERAVLERLDCAQTLIQPDSVLAQARVRGAELPASTADLMSVLPEATQNNSDWQAFGGGGSGGRPMLDPIGRPVPFYGDQVTAEGFDYGGGGSYAMHAIGGLDGIFINNGQQLVAFDPLRSDDLLWESPSPMRDEGSRQRDFSNSINQNMVLAAAANSEIVVAALQVPDRSSTVRYQNAFTIIHRMPERRLFAFERSTGKLLWSHYDRIDGPVSRRFGGHSACGPPLIVGDTLYAPTHDRSGAIAFYISAYDVRTGEPKWRRLICSSQQEVNMFGNARMEFAAGPLCASRGLLFGSSNLGVCYCLETETGRARWVTAYEVIRMPPTALHSQDYRPVYFQNSAPVVTDGVMCATPLDSANVLGIDCETGQLLWSLPHEADVDVDLANGQTGEDNDVRWLFGAIDDEFLLAGSGVVAVKARPTGARGKAEARQVLGRSSLQFEQRMEQPRPAVSDRWIYFPTQRGIRVFDREGKPAPHSGQMRTQNGGNLMLTGGLVTALGNRYFEILLDARALRARAEEEILKNPDDPTAILRLCTLRSALAGDDPKALEQLENSYRQGLDACAKQGLPANNPLRTTFQRNLFEIAMRRGSVQEGAQAIASLREAARLAPNLQAYLRAESALLLVLSNDPQALLQELQTLEERASGETHPLPMAGGPVLVDAYVVWRRAMLMPDPSQQITNWQQLLAKYPEATLRNKTAGQVAQAAIAELILQHGEEVYAAIEERAAEQLRLAGDDLTALRQVSSAYPHSMAARQARRQLLDAAVTAGDLANAAEVYATASRGGNTSPGLLRRVLEAARLRGNIALAEALAANLSAYADQPSDWPADEGRDYGSVLQELEPGLRYTQPEPADSTRLPSTKVLEVANTDSVYGFRSLPTWHATGFLEPVDTPFYVAIDDQVRAFDLTGEQAKPLFTHKTGWIANVWVVGDTLLIPSLSQLVALDYRTGAVKWQLPAQNSLFDCHGLASGVVIVTRQGNSEDDMQLLGVEPLTGTILFTQPMPTNNHGLQPKLLANDMLLLHAPTGGEVRVERLDPLTGRSYRSFPLTARLRQQIKLRPDILRSQLFPQMLSANEDHLFLPVDAASAEGPPRILAIAEDGSVSWTWNGTPGRRLVMSALRDDRLVAVESKTPGGSRIVIMSQSDGEVLRDADLGPDLQIWNWRRSRAATPAPRGLLCTDRDPERGDPRLAYIAIEEGGPAFLQSLRDLDEIVRSPWMTEDLLCYGLRSRRGGPLRIYALNLKDRSGAFLNGKTNWRLPIDASRLHECEMTPVGPYTVVVTDRKLHVLTDSQR